MTSNEQDRAKLERFDTDEELPRLVLTRRLLADLIERCIAAEGHLLPSDARGEHDVEIDVEDDYGTERFSSPADIPTVRFPETTTSVAVSFRRFLPFDAGRGGYYPIHVNFRFRSSSGSKVSISVRASEARDRALGLLERIRQLIEPHEISSTFFHREPWMTIGAILFFSVALWLLFAVVALVGSSREWLGQPSTWYWLVVCLVAFSYIAISITAFPKCAFETRKWEKLEGWRQWAARSFIGALVFGVLFSALLRKIATTLGFTLQ